MVQQPRRIRLSPEARQAIERQLAAFREKFGRDPNDDDPILFDPDADDPVPLSDEKYERMMIEAMTEVGISQAMIFAFKRTGRIVTERNKHLLTAEELRIRFTGKELLAGQAPAVWPPKGPLRLLLRG